MALARLTIHTCELTTHDIDDNSSARGRILFLRCVSENHLYIQILNLVCTILQLFGLLKNETE